MSGFNDDVRLLIKWSIVCSVPDKSVIDKLREFGSWFVDKVSNEACKIGIYYSFEHEPVSCHYAAPGDMEACTNAYDNIHRNTPAVMFVLHILPAAHSDEYEWMRALSNRYGLIRQGVLLDNAINKFPGMDHVEVFRNVSQWISRASSKLCIGKDMAAQSFDLRVGPGNCTQSAGRQFNQQAILSAVNQVLHGENNYMNREESAVRVSGFPSYFNEFGIAQLFRDLSVTGVSLSPSGAVVAFANKFHAFQACAMDCTILDRAHTIRIEPLSAEVREQLNL